MPSERPRQRQQRVRHEAGDYVPISKNDTVENNHPVSIDVKSDAVEVAKREEKQNESHSEDKKVDSFRATEGSSYRRKDEWKYNQRKNEMTRGNANRGRGGYSRGGGRRSEYEAPQRKTQMRPADTNVAYQEAREYEPVMIMESKKDTEKEVQSLPEPTKYRRSEVISNWLRYDDLPPEDEPEDGEDYLMGEDFSQVLNLNVNKSCGGFLHLKGEISWGNMDQSHLENHGLGALKVTDLIASLGTIPFHEQLKIPDEALPVFLVSSMKADAEKSRASYQPNQEHVTDIEINQKILESLKLSENEPIKLSSEEPKSCDTLNAYDATLKFSSAFKPESTDVDLDTLTGDSAAEDSPHVRVTMEETFERVEKEIISKSSSSQSKTVDSVPSVVNKLPSKVDVLESDSRQSKSIDAPKTKIISPQISSVPTANKPNFNFGLSKANKSSRKGNTEKKSVDEVQPKTSEEKPLKIDLNKPTITKKEAPVLVKESEVENLEDWLDSVLDD